MRHIISILLENEPGALCRVANMFSARAFNIESLSVAPTEDPSLSRMTLVTRGSDEIVEQISKQLHKLVDVVKLQDLTEGSHIEREIMLIKLKASGEEREEIKRLTDIFRGRVLDVSSNTYTIEVTGDGDKLDAFVSAVDAQLILEVVRSGPLGIARREKSLHV
ncbi:MAG: acetolactate synthase small subunit [Gammaproteobacteria bacterium]|nr:MAG: acetolactate synthase small subunit [Gammaproteobacteria bacterium]